MYCTKCNKKADWLWHGLCGTCRAYPVTDEMKAKMLSNNGMKKKILGEKKNESVKYKL